MTSISDKYKSFSDNLATDLFKAVVERYGIPFDELWELYSKEKSKNLQNIEPQEIETKEIEVSTTDILSMKVAELKALCKTRGLKVSGKKNDLLERLLGRKVDDKEVKSPVRPKKKSKSFTAKEKDVVKKVKPPSLKISKNSNGDYMHNDSKLVFNQETKKVFAKYIEGEGNQPLTKEDIELCNKFRFAYEMPDNLNVKRTKAEEVRLENLLADEEEEVNQARLKRGVRMREGDVEENETEKNIEKMVGEALKGNLDEEVVEEEVDDDEEEEEYEEVVDDDEEVVEEEVDDEEEYEEEVVEENPKKEDGEEEVEEEDDEEEVEYEEVEEEDDEEEYEEVVDDDEVVEENPKEEVEYEEEDDEEEYEEVVDDDEVVEENPKEEVEYEEVEYEEVEEDEEVEYEEVVDDDVAEEDGEEEVEYEEVEEDEEVEYEEVEVVLDSDGNEIEYESEAENIDDILNDSDFGSENDDDEEEYE